MYVCMCVLENESWTENESKRETDGGERFASVQKSKKKRERKNDREREREQYE